MIPLLLLACTTTGGAPAGGDGSAAGELADVIAVDADGDDGAWTFAVTIRSPDEGCDRYAQWWEVVDDDGARLRYRRILNHSHVDEQPFTRSGEPVPIVRDQVVVVRAWMFPDGYGGQAMRGSVADGFSAWEAPDGWAEALASEAPQPDGCAF